MNARIHPKPLLLAMLVCSASVMAGTEAPHPEELVVVSSRIAVPLRQIGSSVSVITEDEILAHGNLSLHDILRQQPSIGTTNAGGAGKSTSLRIRGEEGFRTLTLFDGLRLLDPSGPQVGPRMEHLLTSGVARVEILRGPQGLGHGADAGGVVNISTRRLEQGWRSQINAQQGKFGSEHYSAFVSGNTEQLDLFLSGTDYRTDGFNSRLSDNQQRDHDGYRNSTLHGTLGWQLNEQWYLQGVHRDIDSSAEYDGCFSNISFSTVHDCQADSRQRASRLMLRYSNGVTEQELAYSNTRTRNQDYSEGMPAFGSRGELERLEYVGSYRGFEHFTLAYGADHENIGYTAYERDNLGVFAEYLSTFSDTWFITAGLRHDNNDDFGNHNSYRLSTAYLYPMPTHGGQLKLRASLGSGFRAPSPYEIGYNNRPNTPPPAALVELQEERSRGYELGIEYSIDHQLSLELTHFNQRVTNAITFDMASFSGYLQDEGTGRSRGFEAAARWMLAEQWDLRANHTYNQATQADGQQRIRRPRHLSNIGINYYGLDERLSVAAFYRASSNSVDVTSGQRVRLDNFGVLDLSLRYRVNPMLSLHARVENADNRRYMEVVDFNSAPRAAYIGLQLDFAAR